MRPARHIEACTAAHRRVLATLAGLTDDVARRDSLLPGWHVAHVVTHLARNADSHVRMLEGARRGEVVDQYAPGQRAADIDAGAARGAAELVADLESSIAALEDAWSAVADDVWRTGRARTNAGECSVADLPFRRWREVEIHHADLGLDFGIEDWSDDYVELELPRTLARLHERIAEPDRRRVLAWLLGRREEPAWPPIGPWQGEHRPPAR